MQPTLSHRGTKETSSSSGVFVPIGEEPNFPLLVSPLTPTTPRWYGAGVALGIIFTGMAVCGLVALILSIQYNNDATRRLGLLESSETDIQSEVTALTAVVTILQGKIPAVQSNYWLMAQTFGAFSNVDNLMHYATTQSVSWTVTGSNSAFTVPLTGSYFFSVSTVAQYNTGNFTFNQNGNALAWTAQSTYSSAFSGVFPLVVGDVVTIGFIVNPGTTIGAGYMIMAYLYA